MQLMILPSLDIFRSTAVYFHTAYRHFIHAESSIRWWHKMLSINCSMQGMPLNEKAAVVASNAEATSGAHALSAKSIVSRFL